MRPLILISNDDGYSSPGIELLSHLATEFGHVIVMAPNGNASAKSHSLTTTQPLYVTHTLQRRGLDIYACTGTPADCVKLALEHFCPRRPDLVLSGINHGSNASINILYSGTMGAALEAAVCGYPAIGFSLLSYDENTQCNEVIPYMRQIIAYALTHKLPEGIALNVNIPCAVDKQGQSIATAKGIRVCRASRAQWTDSFQKYTDTNGEPYYSLSGNFISDDEGADTDLGALNAGYIAVVPCVPDFTSHDAIHTLDGLNTPKP